MRFSTGGYTGLNERGKFRASMTLRGFASEAGVNSVPLLEMERETRLPLRTCPIRKPEAKILHFRVLQASEFQ